MARHDDTDRRDDRSFNARGRDTGGGSRQRREFGEDRADSDENDGQSGGPRGGYGQYSGGSEDDPDRWTVGGNNRSGDRSGGGNESRSGSSSGYRNGGRSQQSYRGARDGGEAEGRGGYGGAPGGPRSGQVSGASQSGRGGHSGLDRSGYGSGLTEQSENMKAGQSEDDDFEPHYTSWRDEQMRSFDEDYRAFRSERGKKFGADFDEFRQSRERASQESGAGKGKGETQI